jgi:hypothetical protein
MSIAVPAPFLPPVTPPTIAWDVVLAIADLVLAVLAVKAVSDATKNKSDSKPDSTTQDCPKKDEPASDAKPKEQPEIDEGRQNIHKAGTNEHKTRSASPKGKPTTWSNPDEADALTQEAYEKGTVTQTHPDGSPAEIKWDAGKPVGENGETQVTVKVKKPTVQSDGSIKPGKIHGFPSGPKGVPKS